MLPARDVDVDGVGRRGRRVHRRRQRADVGRAEVPAGDVDDHVRARLRVQRHAALTDAHDRVVGDDLVERGDVQVRGERPRDAGREGRDEADVERLGDRDVHRDRRDLAAEAGELGAPEENSIVEPPHGGIA